MLAHGLLICTNLCPVSQLETAGHYTVYALEGRGGEVRWHHTPGDFQMPTAYQPVSGVTDAQTYVHSDGHTDIHSDRPTPMVMGAQT